MIGKTLGHYEIIGKLGSGGMGAGCAVPLPSGQLKKYYQYDMLLS
jgi:hypothetical protein